jgi:hypothetical protein
MARSDLLGRLADLSEEAIQRLSDAPGADRVMGAMNSMRDRVDELQRRVRGLEDLEKRIAALEGKVDELATSGSTSSSGSGSRGAASSGVRGTTKTTSTKSSGGSPTRKSDAAKKS